MLAFRGVYYRNAEAIECFIDISQVVAVGVDDINKFGFLSASPLAILVRGRCISKTLPRRGDRTEEVMVIIEVVDDRLDTPREEIVVHYLLVGMNNHPRRAGMGWARFLVLEELPSGQF